MHTLTIPDLDFAPVNRKKVTVRFDDPAVSSDGVALYLGEVDRRIGLTERLVRAIADGRRQSHVDHRLLDLLRQRAYQICCGYEDADDCDALRADPVFKTAVGRDPAEDGALGSQPTMTRLENAVTVRDLVRLGYAFIDHFIASYDRPPRMIVLDMDPTTDVAHGQQQLALFNAFENEYCFMPFHVYEGTSGKFITSVLRSGKSPAAAEILGVLRRIVRRVRQAWPQVRIAFRGDSHHTKPALMDWMQAHGVDFVTGLEPNARRKALFAPAIQAAERKFRARPLNGPIRAYAAGEYARFIVTSFQAAGAKYLYETAYCGRGKMELMIKDHKTALKSDRTSCHRKEANQFRLFLHSAAYVLMHALRDNLLKGSELARAQFDTLRLKLLKIGARLEAGRTFLRFHFPAACPAQAEFTRMSSILGVLNTT